MIDEEDSDGDGEQPGYWDEMKQRLKTDNPDASDASDDETLPDEVSPESELSLDDDSEPEPTTIAPQPVLPRWDHLKWVGRQGLIQSLLGMVKGDRRILSLVGMTGIGKTALAIRLSAELTPQFERFGFVDFDQDNPDFRFVARTVLGERLHRVNRETIDPGSFLIRAIDVGKKGCFIPSMCQHIGSKFFAAHGGKIGFHG